LYGAYLIIENTLKPPVDRFFENLHSRAVSSFYQAFQIGLTFTLVCFGWIFFRANNVAHAVTILVKIFSKSLISLPSFDGWENALVVMALILFLGLMEWLGKENQYAIERLGSNWPKLVRWAFYSSLIFSIGMFMQTTETPFLYFRF
jgi:hypothetical protein